MSTISPLPTPPSRDDPTNFSTRADAFLEALPTFQSEANVVAGEVNSNAATASTAASTASTAASTATTQAGIASAAASSATASANSAAASYDAFDDRYLGSKTSDPTVDNDGNPLLVGALYWNSPAGEMRAWSGTAWAAAYLPAGSYATLNGTETLTNKTITDPKIVLGGDNGIAGQSLVSRGTGLSPIWDSPTAKITRVARTSNTILGLSDKGNLIDITSGTFTQTFDACATLGSGWIVYIRNSGTGDITLDPNGSETIDGLTSYVMYPGEVRLIQCDGTALRTIVLNTFYKVFDTSGTFIKPPGYALFEGMAWGGGASGSKNFGNGGGGGGGAAGCPFRFVTASLASSVSVTIGSGGNPVTPPGAIGVAGGSTTFGSLFTAPGAPSPSSAQTGGDGGPVVAGLTGWSGPSGTAGAGSASVYTGGSGAGDNLGSAASGGASIYGAGGGGNGGAATPGNGGASVFAGAGGAGSSASNGSPGSAPGGGGGGTRTGAQSGAGARGELRIWGVV